MQQVEAAVGPDHDPPRSPIGVAKRQQPGQSPDTPQEQAEPGSPQPALLPAGALDQVRSRLIGQFGALAEVPRRVRLLPVREIGAQDVQDRRRVFAPAGHAEVDLAGGAMAVADQKVHDGGVLGRRQCPFFPKALGHVPEGEVHCHGRVIGQGTQDRLQGRVIAQPGPQPGPQESHGQQSAADQRQEGGGNLRKERGQEIFQEAPALPHTAQGSDALLQRLHARIGLSQHTSAGSIGKERGEQELPQPAQQEAEGRPKGKTTRPRPEAFVPFHQEAEDGRDLPVHGAAGVQDQGPRGRVLEKGGNVQVNPARRDLDGRRGRAAPYPDTEEASDAAANRSKRGDAHGCEGLDETLQDVEAHVDALAGRHRRLRSRQRKERRDRPGLHEIKPPLRQRPFDVLRRAEVRRHPAAEVGQRRQLSCVEDWLLLQGGRHGAEDGTGFLPGRHDLLAGNAHLYNGPGVGVHHPVIGSDPTTDQGLSQSPGCVDHHLIAPPVDRIGSEQDARRLGREQLLHDDRDADGGGRNPLAGPVGNGARGPEGGPAAADGRQQRCLAANIQVGLHLSGEGGAGQVLGRGGRTHGHSRFPESSVRVTDSCRHLRRHDCPGKKSADGVGSPRQRGHVTCRRLLGQALDLRLQGVDGREKPVGGRGDHKPRRYRQVRPQQFAQVGALAAGERAIVLADFSQPTNQSHVAIRCVQERFAIKLSYERGRCRDWQVQSSPCM